MLSINWHTKGRLMVAELFPENGGSVILTDESGQKFVMYTRNGEWLALYRALPKAPGFMLHRMDKDMTSLRDPADVEQFIESFTRKAAKIEKAA